ncbi:peptidylprolyl isomerase [soil metagenome]|nr:peptidylprolyl isomerase [Trueperaceae bacterium]
MATATQGDTVQVHYTGRLEDGTVFDTSEGRDPLSFTVGAGQVIPGFDEAVSGMGPGDSKTVRIGPGDGYGDRRDDLVLQVPKEQLPDGLEPEIGMELSLRGEDGRQLPVRVADVGDEAITLDANHPLAGQPLTFDLTLVEVD